MKQAAFQIVLPAIGASSNRGAMGWCNISLIETGDRTILFDTGSNDDRPERSLSLRMGGRRDIDAVFCRTF